MIVSITALRGLVVYSETLEFYNIGEKREFSYCCPFVPSHDLTPCPIFELLNIFLRITFHVSRAPRAIHLAMILSSVFAIRTRLFVKNIPPSASVCRVDEEIRGPDTGTGKGTGLDAPAHNPQSTLTQA
jgi:hypothetical protein